VGEAPSGEQALELVERLQPDVVLMDLKMPGMDGLCATRKLHQHFPQCRVIIVSAVLEPSIVSQALEAGARGCLLKLMEPEELIEAIRTVATGIKAVVFSPQIALSLVTRVNPTTITTSNKPSEQTTVPTPAATTTTTPAPLASLELTSREQEVLQLLSQGLTNKQIGYNLKLSEKTVKLHVSIVMAKLGAQSRTQAALYAVQAGLIQPHDNEMKLDGVKLGEEG